jgi:hypothetical protein
MSLRPYQLQAASDIRRALSAGRQDKERTE